MRGETCNHLKAGGPGKYSTARLEFSDFELHLIGFRFADIGWVRHDEVERAVFESGEQVAQMKLNTRFKLKSCGIGAGDFQGRGRDVDGVDVGLRQLFG